MSDGAPCALLIADRGIAKVQSSWRRMGPQVRP